MENQSPPSSPASIGQTKAINCPTCGAPITLRALGSSVMVVCPACRTQLDVSRPQIRVIQKFKEAAASFELTLGSRGTLRGKTYEVIGAMRRSDGGYFWEEFLLFNPFIGFRWLVLDQGHWSFASTVKDISFIHTGYVGTQYRGRDYRKFHVGSAVVSTVIGEFYWRVKKGDKTATTDFVSPPWMLSQEKTRYELTWSLLQYIEPDEIAEAFKVGVPERDGIAPHQPNPAAETLRSIKIPILLTLALALAIQLGTIIRAHGQHIPLGSYTPSTDRSHETVLGPVHLDARRSLNELTASSSVNNGWVELDYALVSKATGQSYEFGNEFEFYSGRDSDGYWSEGSNSASVLLTSLPRGDYDLVVQTDWGNSSGGDPQGPIYLSLTHDVVPWRNFWLATAAILIYPLVLVVRTLVFDRKRWSESEFNPYPEKES
jgi:hypothetical protein